MTVKLIVSNTSQPAANEQYVYSQDVIRIGRDKHSDLTISDEKRVISKNHAELRRAESGFELVDLGSKNFTFLNGRRLKADSPVSIQDGEVFRIGDFEITFQVVPEARVAYDDRTVFDVAYVNPFSEDCRQLAELLHRIRKTYIHEAEQRRDDAVAEALEEAFPAFERGNASTLMDVVLDRVEPSTLEHAGYRTSPAPPPEALPVAPPPDVTPTASETPPPGKAQPYTQKIFMQSLVESLLGSLAGLLSTPWKFRHEFIGQTIVQSARQIPIYENDPEALREYLLDESITSEERTARVAQLEKAVSELEMHQVAVLDGYKASVQNGVKFIMEELDPDNVKSSVPQGALQKMMPALAAAEVLRLIEVKCAELKTEDWATAERRVFRPTFIKAYLARMTSGRRRFDTTPGEPGDMGFST